MNIRRAILITIVACAPAAQADYSVLDTGEIMKPGQYKFTGTGQVLTENAGVNLGARADMGFNEQFGVRALLGFGKTDMFVGGLVKWTPMQDTDTQPAIGGNVGLLYVKDGDIRDMIIMTQPLVSKRVEIENVVFTPYGALPIGVRMRKSDNPAVDEDTEVTLQMVVGSQLKIPQFENLEFIAEVGIDLNESPGYLSVGAVYYFDSTGEGFQRGGGKSGDDESDSGPIKDDGVPAEE